MIPLQTYPSRDALMAGAAGRLTEALRAGFAVRGSACAALSGGSTPEPAYAVLALQDLDWTKVTFSLVDERFAPPSNSSSNEAMLRRALAPALAKGAKLVPMWCDETLQNAADSADALYSKLHFDVALMGMGNDGHTASWFPGADGLEAALDPASPRTVMAIHAPGALGSFERLTLTLAAVARADTIVLLITGVEKFQRFSEAINAPNGPLASIAKYAPGKLDVLWAT